MRLISLNTWGGRAGREGLLSFFEKHKDVDIFCLQEIWSAPYEHLEGLPAGGRKIDHKEAMAYGLQEISVVLSEHTPFFASSFLDDYGLLLFVKKDFKIEQTGEVYVHLYKGFIPTGDVGHHARNIQYVTFKNGGSSVTVMNFHGLWNGEGKGDSEARLAQSDKIVNFLETLQTPVIFCGDFNLNPDTESIRKIESFGLHNLVKEYKISSTRSSIYTKPEKLADYVFVSDSIKVNEFQVLPDEVSDHLPLYLDFDLK